MIKHVSYLLLAAATTLSCSDSHHGLTSPRDQPRFNTTAQGDPGLVVTISGPTTVTNAQAETYSASVSGGSGPFLFYWSYAMCNKDDFGTWCMNTTDPYEDGADLNQIDYTFGDYEEETRIIVDVRQSVTGGLSGVDTIEAFGPAHWRFPSAPPDPLHNRCSRDQTPGWYPFEDGSGQLYRRNVCTNIREYQPQ
jgi:hypothetical protein